jgi:hypothetical protein
MPSTEEPLEALFRTRLLPLAEELHRRGVSFFALGPDDCAESWYEGAPSNPEFVEFEGDDWSPSLRALWESQGLVELADLIEPLRELAEVLGPRTDEAAEVSPFVYVMY